VKKITVTANSVSEALAQVQKEYGVREDEYSYKVIEKGFKGIFGLMSKEAVVEVTLKEGFFKRKLEAWSNTGCGATHCCPLFESS